MFIVHFSGYLKYLCEEIKCEVDADVCLAAASGGSLNV